mmetsp:Transcript_6664/g.17925  ORF Transcript_6664/g.17925 Transcript_6664/m.17925 type:complete len:307 (-) Transcript_6664:2052-2972(-)
MCDMSHSGRSSTRPAGAGVAFSCALHVPRMCGNSASRRGGLAARSRDCRAISRGRAARDARSRGARYCGEDRAATPSDDGAEGKNLDLTSQAQAQAQAQIDKARALALSFADETAKRINATKGIFRSFALFSLYFTALMLIVRRSVMAATLPFERILLASLAIILPDLARYSFADLSRNITVLRRARNPDNIEEEMFPYHVRLVTLTTLLKVVGFFTAGLAGISTGAVIVCASQVVFNSLVTLRWVNGSLFLMRREDRAPVLLLDTVACGLCLCCGFGVAPQMCAAVFLAIVCLYWLSKYDIDVIF